MNFFNKHLILTNILLICLTAVVLVILAMYGLDIWTSHGKVQVVPNVRSMTVMEATSVLKGCGLKVEVSDSVYDTQVARGAVFEQVPPAGNRVKPGRTVFLTINAVSPRQVTMPDLVGISLRQARATLQSLGFSDIREVRVPSDYKDLVVAVKSMGVGLRAGTKMPLDATIIIEVGEGYDPYESLDDSISAEIDGETMVIAEEE